MIRIEVQQDPNSESIAWEIDGPWDADAAASLVEGIEGNIASAEVLGLTLWQCFAPKAPKIMVDFQMLSRPRFRRCLTFKVQFYPGEGITRGAQGAIAIIAEEAQQ
jgi:hypothetical protein